MDDTVVSPEKAEEAKLKARYAGLGAKPGGSDFLRKRLQKGVGIMVKPLSYLIKILSLDFCSPSQSILILATTTWPRPK